MWALLTVNCSNVGGGEVLKKTTIFTPYFITSKTVSFIILLGMKRSWRSSLLLTSQSVNTQLGVVGSAWKPSYSGGLSRRTTDSRLVCHFCPSVVECFLARLRSWVLMSVLVGEGKAFEHSRLAINGVSDFSISWRWAEFSPFLCQQVYF